MLKFKSACIVSVKGKTATKRGVFIPIEDNNMFISADEEMKPKGAYVDFIAFENTELGRYGDTHSIRQSVAKEVRDRMSEAEKNAIPFLGNMKPYEIQNAAQDANAPYVETVPDECYEDLPF
ncbi:MAG: hypothetical protein IKU25_00280 [Clostridia bacterium]|nr:hypothetical protein [Clostridia bacterium]